PDRPGPRAIPRPESLRRERSAVGRRLPGRLDGELIQPPGTSQCGPVRQLDLGVLPGGSADHACADDELPGIPRGVGDLYCADPGDHWSAPADSDSPDLDRDGHPARLAGDDGASSAWPLRPEYRGAGHTDRSGDLAGSG